MPFENKEGPLFPMICRSVVEIRGEQSGWDDGVLRLTADVMLYFIP